MPADRRIDSSRNGVDTGTLSATVDAVRAVPAAGAAQFRTHTEWLSGTHTRTTVHDFAGVGGERTHERTFQLDADHPAVLAGHDNGPTPTEYVLHALAACLTAGLVTVAAARGIRLTEVRCTVTGDLDLNGTLGLDPQVRNGCRHITVRLTVRGDAPASQLRGLLEHSQARSPVLDVITGQVPVTVEVTTA